MNPAPSALDSAAAAFAGFKNNDDGSAVLAAMAAAGKKKRNSLAAWVKANKAAWGKASAAFDMSNPAAAMAAAA